MNDLVLCRCIQKTTFVCTQHLDGGQPQ